MKSSDSATRVHESRTTAKALKIRLQQHKIEKKKEKQADTIQDYKFRIRKEKTIT